MPRSLVVQPVMQRIHPVKTQLNCFRVAVVSKPMSINVVMPLLESRMVELDRQRESLRKRRLVQGLGSFLEEQAFMLLRQSRLSQEDNRSLWQELIYAELYASDSRRLGHCGARAA
uniref:Uncharacterized protein n=1 Tax=Physcomitrium patens TaxID=3218 RepID=A0A7I4A7W9_PHYPA